MAAKKKSGFVHYADMTGAAKVKRTAELLKNPGTRSLVATKDLPKGYDPAFVKKRQMAEKFRAPITEGSSLTYGQVASDSKDASNVAFGPNAVKNSQQLEKDTAAWYDDFQRELKGHTANVAAYGKEANDQSLALQNAEGLTAATDPSAENQDVFAKARAVRQGLNAAYGSQIASNVNSAKTYASLRDSTVATGNKIGGVLNARRATDDLTAKIGAYQQDYRNKVRESEAQNVLAQGIAQGKTAAQLAKIASDNANKSAARAVTKYGIDTAAGTAADKLAAKEAADAAKAAKPKPGKGPEWRTPQQQGAGATEAVNLKDLVARAKSGKPFIDGHAPQPKMNRASAGKKVLANTKPLQDPVLLSATLDAVYDGHLSAATVKRLIAAGYKPSKIAQALGVPTAGQYKTRPLTAAEKAAAAKALQNPLGS